MSLNFSANQYNKAYNPYNLQNWELPRGHRERPRQNAGFTQFIANDKGHLKQGVCRSRESPWGNFVGTWELPLKIPGNKLTNPTARSAAAAINLQQMKSDGDQVINGQTKHVKVPDPLPIKEDRAADCAIHSRTSPERTEPLALEKPPTPAERQPSPPACNGKSPSPAVNFVEAGSSKSPLNWPSSSPSRK